MSRSPHLLVVPYPALGHMIPLFEFIQLLSQRFSLRITVALTPKNLRFLQPFLPAESSGSSVVPLILPFPSHPDIPPGIENIQDLPGPFFVHMMRAFRALSDPLLHWAGSNPNPPTAILSDMFLGWTQPLAQTLRIPRITFYTSGAFAVSVAAWLWLNLPGRPANHERDDLYPIRIDGVPGSPTFPWYQLSPIYRKYKDHPSADSLEHLRENFLGNTVSWGSVINSSREIEGSYVDHLKGITDGGRVWEVGPLLIPAGANQSRAAKERGGSSAGDFRQVMEWLGEQPEASVAYVCFGSQAVLTAAQAAALAAGLERSRVRFVWCVKEIADGQEGFEERVKGRGIILRGWAPQLLILNHSSIGCFVTHCGWNSTLECLSAGVPMLTWPLYADQYTNEQLIVDHLHAGHRVREGTESEPDPDRLAGALNQVMDDKSEVRARVRAIRDSLHNAVREGGSSFQGLAQFVQELHKVASMEDLDGEK